MAFFLDLLSSSLILNSALTPARQRLRRGVCPADNVLVHLLTVAGAAKMLTVCWAILEMNASRDSEQLSITGGVT
jgi:hypothetical protein